VQYPRVVGVPPVQIIEQKMKEFAVVEMRLIHMSIIKYNDMKGMRGI